MLAKEPVAIGESVRQLLFVAVAFGVVLTQEQVNAIVVGAGAAFALVSALIAWVQRSRVSPVAK